MLVATGSTDGRAYVYDISSPHGELLQRLGGHTERVYDTSFHPNEPLLATCSADFTIRLWAARPPKPRIPGNP